MPETEEYGIASFVYAARRPFHPGRFYDYLHRIHWDNGNLLRSKGFFWLASRPDWAGLWSQAGDTMQHGCAGRWWASVPDSEWPEEYIADNKPKNRSWSVRKPFVLSLSKHERLPHAHPLGEHSKIPLPFD